MQVISNQSIYQDINGHVQKLVRNGSLQEALGVFQHSSHCLNVISWSCLVTANARNGKDCTTAAFLLRSMLLHGVLPNKITLISALTAAAHSQVLAEAKFLHELALQLGLDRDLPLCSAFLNTYGRCGSLDQVEVLFRSLSERNVIAWTAVISANARAGHLLRSVELFSLMLLDGVLPDAVAFIAVINACARLGLLSGARKICQLIEESGLLVPAANSGSWDESRALMLANAAIDMFGQCGSIARARAVFDSMGFFRDDVSWNSMIGALARNGDAIEAVAMFQAMLLDGIRPSKVTFLETLHAFSSSSSSFRDFPVDQSIFRAIEVVHALIQSLGLESNALIAAGLITLLAKIGRIGDAAAIFHTARRHRDVVLWTTIIAAYAQNDRPCEAMGFFRRMLLEGFRANGYSIVAALESCRSTMDGSMLESCAGEIKGSSSSQDVIVANALISMYSRCGSIDDALRVFASIIDHRDTVSWNSIIAALSQHDRPGEALRIYWAMLLQGSRPEKITLVTILDACSKIDRSPRARAASAAICSQCVEAGHGSDTAVGAAIVVTHGKNGDFSQALRSLDEIHARDIFAWSGIVTAFAEQGCHVEALACFRAMLLDGIAANDVIFVTVLSSLGHAGLIEECCCYFSGMEIEHGINPSLAHYGCVIDMLSRAGHLAEASIVIEKMPEKDRVAWMSLLGGCKLHEDLEQGSSAAEELIRVNPDNASAYVALIPAIHTK